MKLRKTKSEILMNENNTRNQSNGGKQRSIYEKNKPNRRDMDGRSNHSTLTSIYSENSLIRNDIVKTLDKQIDKIGSRDGSRNKSSNQTKGSVRDDQSVCSYTSGTKSVRSLCSGHSVRSVFEQALVNYKFIMGNCYPLSKVLNIWKALSTHIENQLKQNISIIIPKIGTFTLYKTNLQQDIHNKPILIVNKNLTRTYGLTRKEYDRDKCMKKCKINYGDISKLSNINQFIVEEIIQEVIKSFEKLILTNKNCELPFFNIGKLQIKCKMIRMRFYEDFIKCLNRALYESRTKSDLDCRLSRTSSILSNKTKTHWKAYKPSLEFSSVLPIGDYGSSGDSICTSISSKSGNIKRTQSMCSQVSRRTKDTQSLLSVSNGSTFSTHSCCSAPHTKRENHGPDCMCIVCEEFCPPSTVNPQKIINVPDKTVGDKIEKRSKKNDRGKTEDTQWKSNRDTAQYYRTLAEHRKEKGVCDMITGNSNSTQKDNNNIEEIKKQMKMKKSQERCKEKADKKCIKEMINERLTKLLYEERMRNIDERQKMKEKIKKDLERQMEEKIEEKEKKKRCTTPDYNFDELKNSPFRVGMSNLSETQKRSKDRFRNGVLVK